MLGNMFAEPSAARRAPFLDRSCYCLQDRARARIHELPECAEARAALKEVTLICAQIFLLAGISALALVASVGAASAIPMELTRAQFTAATVGLPAVIETFEEFTAGLQPSPLALDNGTYTAPSPFILGGPPFCPNASKCIIDPLDLTGSRSFSAFPVNTDFWATDFSAVTPTDPFQVTVTGNSGTVVFTHQIADGFSGFSDPTGLTSVTFMNLGTLSGGGISHGNYAFDNVTTAAQAVPEPASSLALFGVGLAGLGWSAGEA
jgi:hypothetical protein